jgi:hypothetical protein
MQSIDTQEHLLRNIMAKSLCFLKPIHDATKGPSEETADKKTPGAKSNGAN